MTFQSNSDSYIQNLQNLMAFVAALCAVGIIAGFMLLYQDEKQKEENYFLSQQKELALNFTSGRRMYHRLMSNFFYGFLNTPAVLEILSKAKSSSPRDVSILQDRLHNMVFPKYKAMLDSGLFYLQFYTPEGENFLRFHRVKHHGDLLPVQNPVVQKSMEKKQPVHGFEKGFSNGVTYYFSAPLFLNGQYLGGVVMSVPSRTIIEALTELDSNHGYAFLLQKNGTGRYLDRNGKVQKHIISGMNWEDTYPLLEPAPSGMSGGARILNTLLLKNKSMWKFFVAGKPASVNGVVDGRAYSLCLVPVMDSHGIFMGYLVSFGKNRFPDNYKKKNFFIIVAGLVVMGALLFLYLRIRWVFNVVSNENKQWEIICEAFPEGTFLLNSDGVITRANSAAAYLLGYEKKELMGKSPQDFFHSHDHVRRRDCPAFQAIQDGRESKTEELFRKKDGSFIPVAMFCSPIKQNGQITGIIFVFHDLTERKNTEEQLRESENLQRLLMESMPAALVIIDEATRVIEYANTEAMNIFGLEEENIVGNVCHKFICPADVDSCPISDLGQHIDNTDRIVLRQGRKPLPVRKTVRQIEIMGRSKMLECFIDMSTHKQAEQANIPINQEKKDSLGNMSHEILTSLNTILGMTRLMLNSELSDRQHSYLTKSHRAAKSLLGAINDILDSSRKESRDMPLENLEFDLLDLLDNVLYVTGIQLVGKEIEFTAGIDRNVPNQLRGDYQKLEKVLIDLAGNAAKFTEQGIIHIWVTLDNIQANHAQDDHVSLRFSIQDTGCGIDPETQKTLFVSSHPHDSSIGGPHGKSGSDLNMVAGLVRLMGGDIEVESKPDKGSSFGFTLSFETRKPGKPPVDLKDHRVLIVEPKENSAKLLKERIAFLRGEPEVVQTASQALEKLSQGPVQLLIISEDLPDMSYNGHGIPTLVMAEMGQKAGPLNIGNGEIIVSRPLGFQAMVYGLRLLLTGSTAVNRNKITEHFAPARVLVAEDNPINQRVVQELLQEIGLSVILANDGKECIEYLENEDVDLILMDIQMPEVNGFEAARKIRAIPKKESLPIVAMTAYSTHDDRVEIFAAGMNDHLSKPIKVKDMIQVLKKWLPLSKERQKGVLISTPSSVLESDQEIINQKEALPRFANREDLFYQVLGKVAVDYGKAADKLQTMLDADQMEDGRFFVHTLRGVMGNIGANTIFEVTSRLEECFVNGQKQEAADMIQTLAGLLQELVSHIQEITSSGEEPVPKPPRPSRQQETNIRELMDILTRRRPADCSRMLEMLETIKTTEDNGLDIDQLVDLIGRYEFDNAMEILSSVIAQSESV